MSYQVYKVIHIVGIIFLFLSLGGMLLHMMNGGTKASNGSRKFTAITHGLAAFAILLGGFGLMARLGMPHMGPHPTWIYVKVAVWLTLGFLPILIWRKGSLSRFFWFLVPALGGLAAYFAILKP